MIALKKTLMVLLFFCFVGALAFPFLYGVYHTPFYPDENLWLLESKYYKSLVIDEQPYSDFAGDPNDDKWILMSLWDQPCAAKRIFIAVSDVFHKDMRSIELTRWDFAKSDEYNSGLNTVPPKGVLRFYRYISGVFGILSCILVFLIGMKASNVYGGAFAAIFMAYNPLMVTSCSRAMAEGVLIFFITLCVYLAGVFLKYLSDKRYAMVLILSGIIGIASGLAVGTKFNGAIGFAVFAGLCACLLAVRFGGTLKDRPARTVILSVFLAAVIALSVFILIDPFLRLAPAQNTIRMFNHRIATARWQGVAFNSQLGSIPERFVYIWRTLFKSGVHIPALFILVITGLSLMIKDEFRQIIKNRRPSFRLAVLVWSFITFAALLCTLTLNWARYLVPLIPEIALLSGYSAAWIFRQAAGIVGPNLSGRR